MSYESRKRHRIKTLDAAESVKALIEEKKIKIKNAHKYGDLIGEEKLQNEIIDLGKKIGIDPFEQDA
ncbi:MAG: hypothetical protein WA063_05950 [Minisyncoccia bacterium]